MNKFLIIFISTAIFSGCPLIPTAWKSVRPGGGVEPTPTAVVTAGPTQTVEELDAQVTADLETSMDSDLKQIDADLKTIDSEALQY